MKQTGESWLAWRNKGIGSSDAPIILGVSPWSTPFQLWEEKTGRKKRDFSNWATERGNKLEPTIRTRYELENDMECQAATVEHKDCTYLRASMDGYNVLKKIGAEFKAPGKDDHELARSGKVPEKYYPQIQHQFIVSGAERIDYVSYSLDREFYTSGQYEKGEMLTVQVYPDKEFIKNYLKKAKEFWECVTSDAPPGVTNKDVIKMELSAELEDLSNDWLVADDTLNHWKKELARLKSEIIEKIKHHKSAVTFYGLKAQKITKKGAINYSKVPQLEGVDLEDYRKKASSYYKISKV